MWGPNTIACTTIQMTDDSNTAPPARPTHSNEQHDDHEEHSKRKRIAAIAGRFASLASSSASTVAKDVSEAATDASEQVSKTASNTRHAAATQSVGLLHAMSLTTKPHASTPAGALDKDKHWYEYESPLHARRRIAEYESPLHARRRLAAIANQLGLATSSSKQAPSLLSVFSASSPRHHVTSSQNKWDTLPNYKDLPGEGGWKGCAWSVWGPKDELGTINLLNDQAVLRAAKEEIRTGRTITLNWPLHLPAEPFFRRRAVTHKPFGKGGDCYIKRRDEFVKHTQQQPGMENVVNRGEDSSVPVSDEVLELNTQSGSQWDGLRHYGHIPLNVFYGGRTRAEIQDTFNDTSPQPTNPREWDSEAARKRNVLGIQNLAQHGICGRGVLLDVFEYLSIHGLDGVKRDDYAYDLWPEYGVGKGYDPRSGFRITVADLQATAQWQGVTLTKGDILLVRSGFTARYYTLSAEERAAWSAPVHADGGEGMRFAGVEQGEAMKEFLWDNHFAAVAGDSPAFEARPTRNGETMLHETLLAMWGMPIGELFDLEQLSRHCRANRTYSFYFHSLPLNLFGGIASTANASATF